jgi:gliding motility-associated-like protein
MKYFLLLMLWLVSLRANSQINLNDGLIGCYPFSGNVFDLSGNANHGTVNGAKLTSDRFGNPSSAYDFDGIDDFIEITSKGLELNVFSYSAWVKPKSLPSSGQAMFIFSVGSAYGDQHILLGNNYTQRHTGFSHGSYLRVAQNVNCTQSTFPDVDKWYHLVLVKSEDSYSFFIDGKEICSDRINGETAFYGTGPVKATIGARNNYGQATNGVIDDIHLYDRVLSNTEIDALYNGTPTDPRVVTIKSNNDTPCAGTTLNLTAEINALRPTFTWKVNGITIPSTMGQNFSYDMPASTEDYELNIEVSSSIASCFVSAPPSYRMSVLVKNCSTAPPENKNILNVPSAFSPNHDFVNDTWEITGSSGYEELSVWVYNRWGEVVFYSKDYLNAWDGRYKGQLVPSGVYTFKIQSQNKLVKSGELNIFR